LLQLKEQMKRDKDTMQQGMDEKLQDLRTRLTQIEEWMTQQEDTKKIIGICKQLVREAEARTDSRINSIENS